jgi:hypothetical protein
MCALINSLLYVTTESRFQCIAVFVMENIAAPYFPRIHYLMMLLDKLSKILSSYMFWCLNISKIYARLRYFFCANTATECYMASYNVLAVHSEMLFCNGVVCGIAGSNPDDSRCK